MMRNYILSAKKFKYILVQDTYIEGESMFVYLHTISSHFHTFFKKTKTDIFALKNKTWGTIEALDVKKSYILHIVPLYKLFIRL